MFRKIICEIVLILLFIGVLTVAFSVNEVYAATRVYLAPSNYIFDWNNGTIGTRFNITVRVDNVDDLAAFSVGMYFNDSIINVTRWFEPKLDPEYVFYGKGTSALPTPPNVVYNHYSPDVGEVRVACSLFPHPPTQDPFSGSGILCLIEFVITAVPGRGEILFCLLDISHPETYLLDQDANYIISTIEDGMFYFLSPSMWDIRIVDSAGDVGMYSSLGLDSLDRPFMSYYDYTNGNLKFTNTNGTAWTIVTLDWTGDVGRYTSIARDSADISYYDATNGDLKYIKWTPTGWINQTVDSTGNVGLYSSLALDSLNYPHISYYDDTNLYLKYAYWTGLAWSFRNVIGLEVDGYTSLVLDSLGNPHICCYDKGISNILIYVYWTGSSWSIEMVDFVCGYCSLALDSLGNPHISYYDKYDGDLKYAYWTGLAWSKQRVDSTGDVGYYCSLALDSLGNPHISYYDCTNGDLKYAYWSGSSWSIQKVDSVGDVGQYTSLALDSSNNPHISYYDLTNGYLKYASGLAHEIALTSVTSSKTVVGQGFTCNINATVQNIGFSDEDFTVAAYAQMEGTQNGLVGYWGFDQTEGTYAIDLSGNNNHGTINGASWTNGKFGNALSFDGVDDYVEVPHTDSLTPTEITIEAWIYPESWTHNPLADVIVVKRTTTGDGYMFFWFATTGTINIDFGGGTQRWDTEYNPPLNTWTHLAYTFSTVDKGKFYVNGALYKTTTLGAYSSSTAPLRIGMDTTTPRHWFNGSIDEVRIYNRALTQNEIKAVASSGAIQTQTTTLSSRSSTTIIFTWNTTGFAKGNYTISAYAWPVPGETDTTDNNITDGWVFITIAGDVTSASGSPDGRVDMRDIGDICNKFMATPSSHGWNPNMDINDDGVVNMRDIGIACNNFMKT